MSVIRWAPFSAFTSLEREMQSMLDRFTFRPWIEGLGWKPFTDVFRENGVLVIRAELPGIDLEHVTIDVEDNVLHIKGEKEETKEIEEDDRYVKECQYGSFQRDIVLPDGVDHERIKATFENGVLMVRVPIPTPVVEGKAPIKIEVSPPEKQLA